MLLLDTNVISELRAGKPHPSASLRAWAAQQPAHQLYLSAITVLELEMASSGWTEGYPQGEALRIWLNGVLEEFSRAFSPSPDRLPSSARRCTSPTAARTATR